MPKSLDIILRSSGGPVSDYKPEIQSRKLFKRYNLFGLFKVFRIKTFCVNLDL